MPAPSSRLEAGVMRNAWVALCTWLAWLNGDVAYRSFVAHQRNHHPDSAPPSRAAFYRMEQERRWNGIRRCC